MQGTPVSTSVNPPAYPKPDSVRQQRRERMRLTLVAGLLALVTLFAGAYYFAVRPVTLRIAVGPPNSDDVRVVQTLAHTFALENAQVRLRPVITEGSGASADMIGAENTDLAVVRGDSDLPKSALAVATLRKNIVVLWAPDHASGDKAAISSIEQLAGRRVGVVGRAPGNVSVLRMILRQYEIDPDRVEIVQFSTAGIAESLRQAQADAFFAVGPLNSKITADAIAATSRDGRPVFLAIDAAETIAQRYPMFEATDIPAGNFGAAPTRPGGEIKTISFNHHIVARQSLSESIVAVLARQLFAARQTVLNEFPQSARLETPDTDKDAAVQVHPGAAAYVDGEEKSFLDRYSDYIWWGLMGASALGSLGAWFAGYMRRDDRTASTPLRSRLLEMLGEARICNSIAELDRMQTEGDDILRRTLDCYESGGIDDGALTAFSIALEQFHNAIVDRKMWLAALPAADPKDTAPLRA
jgi:TRAP transporter TAXI family solute receptor